jgi:hypothetical protein
MDIKNTLQTDPETAWLTNGGTILGYCAHPSTTSHPWLAEEMSAISKSQMIPFQIVPISREK